MSDYLANVPTQLTSRRPAVVKKLKAIVARTVLPDERLLRFDLTWGLISNAFVEVWPQNDFGMTTTDRRPFGELFEISPPPGQDDDPEAYAKDRPAITQLVFGALAEWWEEAAGAAFAIPAMAKVEGDPLRLFDLRAREWRMDPMAVKSAERTTELRARLQPQLTERLSLEIVATLRDKLAKIPDREHCHSMFALEGDNGPYRITFQMYREPDHKTVVRSTTLMKPGQLAPILDDPANDWTGIDREALTQELVHEMIAEAWREAGGHDFPIHALLGHVRGDDFATWDVNERRPHTDSMGRAYRR